MTAARGTSHQTDIPTDSRPHFPPQNDAAVSSRLTPASIHPTSPPSPSMPSRGRSTNRYPDSLGRVPLHRRGTSKTYERLEDLLREAGYKETRVFTPETDHNARSAKKHDDVGNNVQGSVGAVVDFITGLVSRGPSFSPETAPPLKDSPEQAALHAWSSPSSPSGHALHIKDDKAKRIPSMTSLSCTDSSESIRRRTYVDVSADSPQRAHACQVVQLHQSSQGLPHHSHSKHGMHQHLLNNRNHHQLNYSSKSTSKTRPNPPNARAYLRHMASAPNIQPLSKHPSLSESSLRSHVIGRKRRTGICHTFTLGNEDSIMESDYGSRTRTKIDDEHQVHPLLARNWIDSVAKALLSGVAGPATLTSDAASTRTIKTASTWKSSALSDREERALSWGTRPPLLCMQVQDMKARTSESRVACTRVMCRSTPTSRTSSRVRNNGYEEHMNVTGSRKKRGTRNHRRGKDRKADVVPSLARTKAENDDWIAPRQYYSGVWGMRGSAQDYPDGAWSENSDANDEDEEEEEEGELNLNRLLVPARRQHSIQSLRRHLQQPPSRMISLHFV